MKSTVHLCFADDEHGYWKSIMRISGNLLPFSGI